MGCSSAALEGTARTEDARTCWAKPSHRRGSLGTSHWLQKELFLLGQKVVSAGERDSCVSGLLTFVRVPLRLHFEMSVQFVTGP